MSNIVETLMEEMIEANAKGMSDDFYSPYNEILCDINRERMSLDRSFWGFGRIIYRRQRKYLGELSSLVLKIRHAQD